MRTITHLLLAGAVTLALCDAGRAQETPPQPSAAASANVRAVTDAVLAQESLPPALPGSPDAGVGAGVLEALPRPLDTPRSLFAPEQPPSAGGVRIDAPYFIPDPQLDFAPFAQPGWFAGAEVQIVKPHLINGSFNSVFPGRIVNNANGQFPLGGNSSVVKLPAGPLDWTASPRVFAGYRLPAGFGEFMIAYRHLGTTGSSSAPDVTGPINLRTHFAFDQLDLDYNSRELSLWPSWDMKWTLGLRMLFLASDTLGTQPFDQASAPGGSGIVYARQASNLFAIGPHSALELIHRLGNSGWALYYRTDFGAGFSYVNANWFTASSTRGPNGRPIPGQTYGFGHQAIPMINGRAGITWQPAPSSFARVFIGYQYEVFWDLSRLPQSNGTPFSPGSMGQYWSQGIVLQATFNW
jgi:hypothetical protein